MITAAIRVSMTVSELAVIVGVTAIGCLVIGAAIGWWLRRGP